MLILFSPALSFVLLSAVNAVDHEVTVYTEKCVNAGTANDVFIKANGKDEDGRHTKLVSKDHWFSPFRQGDVSVQSPSPSVLASQLCQYYRTL